MWERLLCGPQCVDVSRCCGEGDAEPAILREDFMDDELVSVQFDAEESMRLPNAARHTLRSESVIPWADLNGPRRTAVSPQRTRTSDYGYGAGPSLLQSLGATEAAKKTRLRASSPSINPYSKYGFITVKVRASSYLADSSDVMDVEFARHLLALDRDTASVLELRRLAHARYEVQGRPLRVRWGDGKASAELFCIEEKEVDDHSVPEEEIPLGEYIQQMAAIAANVRCPADRRVLTFVDDGEKGDRWEAMRLAVEQAKLREQAADACAKHPWADQASRGLTNRDLRPQFVPTALSSHHSGQSPPQSFGQSFGGQSFGQSLGGQSFGRMPLAPLLAPPRAF